MSTILDELIRDRKLKQLEYQRYLEKIVELTKIIDKGNVQTVPDSIKNSAAKIALYHNLNENEALVNSIHDKIMSTKKADFRANEAKIREVMFCSIFLAS